MIINFNPKHWRIMCRLNPDIFKWENIRETYSYSDIILDSTNNNNKLWETGEGFFLEHHQYLKLKECGCVVISIVIDYEVWKKHYLVAEESLRIFNLTIDPFQSSLEEYIGVKQ